MSILESILIALAANAAYFTRHCWLMRRLSDRRKPPTPPTVTCPCPICGTTIPLTVHHIPTLTVMVDRTDLAAHLLTHEETR